MPKLKIVLAIGTLAIVALLSGVIHFVCGSSLERYIAASMPASAREIGFESNGLKGMLSEPVVHIAFTATSSDMDTIIRRGGFKPGSAEDREFVGQRSGPIWWKPGPLQNTDVLFTRKTRVNTEYLRIDGSGTNAYFLLWGI